MSEGIIGIIIGVVATVAIIVLALRLVSPSKQQVDRAILKFFRRG